MEVSVFRNFWDKEPVSSTLEAMVEAIRSDQRTRELTEGYRQHRLDSLKNESMLFAVPCVFRGGKAQKHVVRLTGLAMVDFDHIDPTTTGAGNCCAELKKTIRDDPHRRPAHAEGCIYRERKEDYYQIKTMEDTTMIQKKEYMKPAMEVLDAEMDSLLLARSVKSVSSPDLGDDVLIYVDEGGSQESAW